MSTKKVTAPKTYDPGRGRPKEHLAYLNEREMAYLRSINGNNMERGPKGLPSFPPEDAVGSSSRSPSSGSRTSSSSSGAGRDSSRGLGQGAGGTAVGRGPGGSSGLGGGGKGAGSSGTQSRGPGGPSGPNSGPSQSSGSKAAPSAPSRTPSSPMGGQGQSFRSPMGAGWHNRDTIDRQRAQVNSARDAIRNTPAARSDLSIGGIRTLNVGPIGTPVKVGGPAAVGTKQIYDRVPQISAPRPSISSVPSGMKYSSPLTPGMTPEDMARRGALMNKYEQEIRDIMRGTPTRTGDPISAGGVPTSRPQPTRTGDPISAGGVPTSRASISVPAKDMTVEDMVRALRPPGRREDGAFGTSSPKKTGFDADLERLMTPDISIPAPPNPEERVLKVEDYIDPSIKQGIADESVYTMGLHGYPKEQMLRPGMYADPSTPSKISKAVADAEAYRDMVASLNRETQKISGVDNVYDPSDEFNQAPKIPNWAQSTYTGRLTSAAEDTVPRDESGVPYGSETPESDDVYGPKNVSPEVQELMADIDRKNKYGVRGIKSFPGVGNVVRAGDALRKVFTGKNTTEADADLKRAYMQGNATQRAELERRYPNLTKFAQQAGLESQLPMSNYENWRQRSFGTGGGGTSTTVAGAGGTPDIGSGGKAEYRPIPRQFADYGQDAASDKKEFGRPQLYYDWDAGVGIPSPGDPDYTLYLKYLEEKAAARAAVS